MTKAGFWKTDWFLGVVVVIFLALFNRFSDLVPSLERKAYDQGVIATSRAPLDKIAVIAIDDQSLANLGRWPWSRDILAKMTDSLSAAKAKAKVIAYTVLFSEPQVDAGYTYVTKLLEMAGAGAPADPAAAPDPDAPAAHSAGQLTQFVTLLKEAEQTLNTDRRLAESFARAGNADGRSDLFSLAVSLYQLLCGSLPFVGDSMAQLMFRIANESATDILSARPGLPPALVAFLDKAMAKDADQRYQTGEEFAAALRAAFAGGGTAAAVGAGADMDISL